MTRCLGIRAARRDPLRLGYTRRVAPSLDLPPFPELTWIGDCWEGFAPRPAHWQRLKVASERLRGGETNFDVIVRRDAPDAPSAEQVEAYRAFVEGGESDVMRVLDAVLAHYRVLRARWLARQPTLELPVAERAEDLVQLTQLSTLYVHPTVSEGQVHLGIALRAGWDQEHGAGVLLLGDRIVRVGSHDDAMYEPTPMRPRAPGAKKAKPPTKKPASQAAKKAKPPAAKKAKPSTKKPAAKKTATKKPAAKKPAAKKTAKAARDARHDRARSAERLRAR